MRFHGDIQTTARGQRYTCLQSFSLNLNNLNCGKLYKLKNFLSSIINWKESKRKMRRENRRETCRSRSYISKHNVWTFFGTCFKQTFILFILANFSLQWPKCLTNNKGRQDLFWFIVSQMVLSMVACPHALRWKSWQQEPVEEKLLHLIVDRKQGARKEGAMDPSQWPTSSSEAPPLKVSRTSQNRTTNWRSRI
jgi:hypothetical protein